MWNQKNNNPTVWLANIKEMCLHESIPVTTVLWRDVNTLSLTMLTICDFEEKSIQTLYNTMHYFYFDDRLLTMTKLIFLSNQIDHWGFRSHQVTTITLTDCQCEAEVTRYKKKGPPQSSTNKINQKLLPLENNYLLFFFSPQHIMNVINYLTKSELCRTPIKRIFTVGGKRWCSRRRRRKESLLFPSALPSISH